MKTYLSLLLFLCYDSMAAGQVLADSTIQKPVQGVRDTFVCMLAEVPPEYPGGHQALLRFIGSHLHFPDSLEGLGGRIIAGFDVEADGSIRNISIKRSPHPAFNPVIIRMLRKMPRWKPGRNDGKPVRAQYILPIVLCPL